MGKARKIRDELSVEALRREAWVPAVPGRPSRSVRLAIRFGPVALKHPKNGPRRSPAELPVTLVDLREEAPPAGVTPLHWRLITTHAVETSADASSAP